MGRETTKPAVRLPGGSHDGGGPDAQVPVPTKGMSEYRLHLATDIMTVYVVGGELADPPGGGQFGLGLESWFQTVPIRENGNDLLQFSCTNSKERGSIALDPDLLNWDFRGRDTADGSTNWGQLRNAVALHYKLDQVSRNGAPPVVSPIQNKFAISLEGIGTNAPFVHWYRDNTKVGGKLPNYSSPFSDAAGNVWIPKKGEFVIFKPYNGSPVGAGWQERVTGLQQFRLQRPARKSPSTTASAKPKPVPASKTSKSKPKQRASAKRAKRPLR